MYTEEASQSSFRMKSVTKFLSYRTEPCNHTTVMRQKLMSEANRHKISLYIPTNVASTFVRFHMQE